VLLKTGEERNTNLRFFDEQFFRAPLTDIEAPMEASMLMQIGLSLLLESSKKELAKM
jgi:hypothetical protein